MANISNHQSSETTKLLVLGESGAGKSGGLASLAAAGYNVRIIDLDNGLDVLRSLVTATNSPYPKDTASRIEFETVTDSMKQLGGRLVPVKASVWQRAVDLVQSWKTPTADYGNIGTWTNKDVLVIDTLSMLADAALKFNLALNMRLGQRPHQSDWGDAQMMVKGLLETLYGDAVKCNVIVNCHLKYNEDQVTGATRAYPVSVGRALDTDIGKYFNNTVRAMTVGNKRKYITTSTNQLELKTSNPLQVKPEYGIETGLADLFRDLRSGAGVPK